MIRGFPRLCAWTCALPAVGALLAGSLRSAPVVLPPDKVALLPAAATRVVDFARDIQPIFEASCVQCHGRGKNKGGFSLETRTDFLEGGDQGTPAVAGQSAASAVIAMVSGLDADNVMPQKGKRLTPAQVAIFRAWIDQGMVWPKEITFFKHEPANLRPVPIASLPADKKFDNPLDGLVDASFRKNGVKWSAPVDDHTFARRVWLDALGVLPPPAELAAFLADRAPDKRAALVRRLISDDQRYAEHWLTFWNDLLRNDYRGTGYIDGGRKQITSWLYTALARNLPYDKFVAELINPGAESEGFTRGIIWRGAVNASMVPPMQAAQGIAQVFMGVNLKCASCHDSFINEYTLKDAYGLASIYATGPLEIAECDKPTGHMGQVKFLYEDLGRIDPELDPSGRKQRLVELITGRSNGRLPRSIVNRIWQRFMGRGLVEPVDEMDKPAWSPELMNWLAEDLVAHGYDLRHTMARILTSQAYQLPAADVGESDEHYVFRGPAVRRLSAEQFTDAVMSLGGLTFAKSDARLLVRGAALSPVPSGALPLEPKWVWIAPDANVKAPPATVIFRKSVTLPTVPDAAVIAISADDAYALKINGKNVSASARRNSTAIYRHDVKTFLQVGNNEFEVTVFNQAPEVGRSSLVTENDSPAGLIMYARLHSGAQTFDVVSDASWATTVGKTAGSAVELGGVDLAPWKLGRALVEVAGAKEDSLPVARASLVAADPLMVALGRPNREQVVTVRQSTATTLQALELTNGQTLAGLLKRAAEKILADPAVADDRLIDRLYLQAVSRGPTPAERTLAAHVVGAPARAEGVEDLLWALTMLPEFQLIN